MEVPYSTILFNKLYQIESEKRDLAHVLPLYIYHLIDVQVSLFANVTSVPLSCDHELHQIRPRYGIPAYILKK